MGSQSMHTLKTKGLALSRGILHGRLFTKFLELWALRDTYEKPGGARYG